MIREAGLMKRKIVTKNYDSLLAFLLQKERKANA